MKDPSSIQKPKTMGRLLIVGGVMVVSIVLLMLIPSAVRSSEDQQGTQQGWQTLYFEDFTLGLGGEWEAIDANGSTGGDYTWGGDADYTYTSGPYSVWATGGLTDGVGLVASDTYTYPDNADSWLIYGPLEVSDVFAVEASFDWWLDSAPGDWLGWCLTTEVGPNGANCDEVRLSGPISTWISGTVSMDVTYGVTTPVYLAFHFTSNDDGQVGTGAFVDNVRISGDYGYPYFLAMAHRDPTPTPTPTPTPAGLNFYETFDNNSNGWDRHQADCCLSGCDSPGAHPAYKYSLWFDGGRYHIRIPLDCRAQTDPPPENGDTRQIMPAVYAPGIRRPRGNTCIQVRGLLERWDQYGSFWGLVFAGSADMNTIYTLEVNNFGDWAVIRRDGYTFPGLNSADDLNIQTRIVPYAGSGPRYPADDFPAANTLRVRINEDSVWLYINGELVKEFSDSAISDLRYVGVIGGVWEMTPTQLGYKYFYVDEGCDDYAP